MVNGISNSGSTAVLQGSFPTAADSYTRNIRQQIANAQKKLQDLSANEELSLDEKLKKRQEIQQEITSLNQQLRQHQTEQRKERQAENSMDEMLGGSRTAAASGKKGTNASQTNVSRAILSADSSMKLARTQGGVAVQMEGRTGVLKAEIQADSGRGASTEKKEAELADLTEKVQETQSAQISTLSEAVKDVEKAAEADRTAETDTKKTDTKKTDTKKTDKAESAETEPTNRNDDAKPADNAPAEAGENAQRIDIRL